MQRPRFDLTWNGIRRRWAVPTKQVYSIEASTTTHPDKYPSAPLFDNTFEPLSSNVTNVDRQSFQSIDEQEQQRSSSVMDFGIFSTTGPPPANNPQNLSRVSHSCDTEVIRSELRVIIAHLAILSRQAREQEEDNDVSQDWKFVAMVVDRLCLILFIMSMTLFTGLTLFSTPNFFKLR